MIFAVEKYENWLSKYLEEVQRQKEEEMKQAEEDTDSILAKIFVKQPG